MCVNWIFMQPTCMKWVRYGFSWALQTAASSQCSSRGNQLTGLWLIVLTEEDWDPRVSVFRLLESGAADSFIRSNHGDLPRDFQNTRVAWWRPAHVTFPSCHDGGKNEHSSCLSWSQQTGSHTKMSLCCKTLKVFQEKTEPSQSAAALIVLLLGHRSGVPPD